MSKRKPASEARLTADDQQDARSGALDGNFERHGVDQVLHARAHGESVHETERDSHDVHTSDEEFLARFLDMQNNGILPSLPEIPGYHTFWATTTNSKDSIPSRLNLGYSLLRADDFPGFEELSLKTGAYPGCIGLNEMVAMKLPTRLFLLYMKQNHHIAPMAEEEKIRRTVEGFEENAERDKGRIIDEDGFKANVVQKGSSAPRFAA